MKSQLWNQRKQESFIKWKCYHNIPLPVTSYCKKLWLSNFHAYGENKSIKPASETEEYI